MQTPTTDKWRLVDHELEGKLSLFLEREWDDCHSWEEVARRLLLTYGIPLSGQTLRRWAADLGIGEAVA